MLIDVPVILQSTPARRNTTKTVTSEATDPQSSNQGNTKPVQASPPPTPKGSGALTAEPAALKPTAQKGTTAVAKIYAPAPA